MSATTGMGERRTISGKLSADLSSGTATRTTSQPASASRWIWFMVAGTSQVIVVVIDWTTTGAPPPIWTPPTTTGRVCARGGSAGVSAGTARISGSHSGSGTSRLNGMELFSLNGVTSRPYVWGNGEAEGGARPVRGAAKAVVQIPPIQ